MHIRTTIESSKTRMLRVLTLALATLMASRSLKGIQEGTPTLNIRGVVERNIAAYSKFETQFHDIAKGAVNGLTLSLADELAPRVRVNAIAPSLTRTQLAREILSNVQKEALIAELHALQRLGTPEDIAAITAFLLSPEAGWITGQIISFDGGRSTLRTMG